MLCPLHTPATKFGEECQYIFSVSLRMQFVSIQNSPAEWSEACGTEAAIKYCSC